MAFLKFTHGTAGLARHFLYLWPVLLLYKFRILSNEKAKAIVFKRFYQQWPASFFEEKATVFCQQVIPEMLNPEAIKKLKWHQAQGHRVIVVSAMFEQVLQTWSTANQTELLATKLEVVNNRLTGNFSSRNCYGHEKVNRIKQTGILEQNPYIYAYGDSEGDEALLRIADLPFYRRFW